MSLKSRASYARILGATMTKQPPQQQIKRRVSVFLRQHEQWNAWIFFSVMAALVSLGMGRGSTALLHAPLVGMLMLYTLKLTALYLRRSTAWGVTGFFFALTPLFPAQLEEVYLCLQMVVLYHILVWARGKRNEFAPRHFFIAGLAIGLTLLRPGHTEFFYLPLVMLMLWSNRRRLPMSISMLLIGAALPTSIFISKQPNIILDITSAPNLSTPLWLPPTAAILLILTTFIVHRSRPERRLAAQIMLASAWITGACLNSGWCYYCPLVPTALTGIALLLHRHLRNQRVLLLLRAAGLIIPFITLCAALIIPTWRVALTSP